jgi:hypothetical protein
MSFQFHFSNVERRWLYRIKWLHVRDLASTLADVRALIDDPYWAGK